jgi:Arc/MetJ-type ribon-helix-helix transcriptional regulator
MRAKVRLSASVDADLVAAAEAAVVSGRAGSVSAWVNDALELKRVHDRRLAALGAFVAAYEAEQGEITPDDIQAARRHARSRAVVVAPAPEPRPSSRGKRKR